MKHFDRTVSQRMQGVHDAGAFLVRKMSTTQPVVRVQAPPPAAITRSVVSPPTFRQPSAASRTHAPPPVLESYQLSEREYLLMNGH